MIGGIKAGLMVLALDKNTFEYMKAELELKTRTPTCGPEQDYLSRFCAHWVRIPVDFNFQLHQLGYLSKQVESWEQPERRLTFDNIAIIHYSGSYSPRDWIFEDSNVEQFNSWVSKHLLPKYGKVDEVDKQTLERCIDHWHMTWQRVRGRTLAELCDRNTTDESIKGGITACKPWVDEEMPLPKNAKMCWRCWRCASSQMQDTIIEESSHDSQARMKNNKGPCTRQRGSKFGHRWHEKRNGAHRRFEKTNPRTNGLKAKTTNTHLTPKHAVRLHDADYASHQEPKQTQLLYPTIKLHHR